MLRQALAHRPSCLCVSDLTSSRLPGFTETCARGIPIFAGGKSCEFKKGIPL